MKAIALIIALGWCLVPASAQENSESLLSPEQVARARELTRPAPVEKRYEIRRGGRVYHGVLIQAAKAENRWPLLNPAAPAGYGFGEANLARDPVSLRPTGLYLFAISF